jgi:hypothetical protein
MGTRDRYGSGEEGCDEARVAMNREDQEDRENREARESRDAREVLEAEPRMRLKNGRGKIFGGPQRGDDESGRGLRELEAGLRVGLVRLPAAAVRLLVAADSGEFGQIARAAATRRSEAVRSIDFLRMLELDGCDFGRRYRAKNRLVAKAQERPRLQFENRRRELARMPVFELRLLELLQGPTQLQIRTRDLRSTRQARARDSHVACGRGRRAGKSGWFWHEVPVGLGAVPARFLRKCVDRAARAIRGRLSDEYGEIRGAGARDAQRLRLRPIRRERLAFRGGAGRFHRAGRVQSLRASFLKK